MTEPVRRRRRPAVSCTLCRKRKIRCNRESPCQNCIRSKNDSCTYDDQPPLRQREIQSYQHGETSRSTSTSPSGLSVPTSRGPSSISSLSGSATSSTIQSTGQPSNLDVEAMKAKIQELEAQLCKATSAAPTQSPTRNLISNMDTLDLGPSGTFHVYQNGCLYTKPHLHPNGVTHRARLFGRSHWINTIGLFRDVVDLIEPISRDDSSKTSMGLQKCKSLGKSIKAQRTPPWPSVPTIDLPLKEVADELVACYLRTFETVYRIVNIHTFKSDYEALWTPQSNPELSFIIQVKLVFALGALTYDEQFSMRALAMQWVYEAQTWLSNPEFKSRLGIEYIQTSILHLLARELIGVSGDSTWVLAGGLLRTAMYTGLHRDPSRLSGKTVSCSEMRRRLWNTVLELALQVSLTTGAPPLISLADFDTLPPGNFDDEQLAAPNPVPKPDTVHTHSSIARAIRRAFPIRLAIVKHLNDLESPHKYEDTLRLDAEFRTIYKTLRSTLHQQRSNSQLPADTFEVSAVEYIIQRYLLSLHIPFVGLALHETKYTYSKNVVVEASLKIYNAASPIGSEASVTSSDILPKTGRQELARLIFCSTGTFRVVAMQAALVVTLELRSHLQEDEGLSLAPMRADLLWVTKNAKSWFMRCIQAGEVNIKGFMFNCMALAQLDAIAEGLKKNEMQARMVEAAEDAVETSMMMLQEVLARDNPMATLDGLEPISSTTFMDDWDFLMSEAMLNTESVDMMAWDTEDAARQDHSCW